MQLIITDVTEMSAGNYCVAGWDVDGQRMVRPLPSGHNWTAAQLANHGIDPGALVEFIPTGQPHNGKYPHRTEDTPVQPYGISLVDDAAFNWFGADAPACHATVAAAFDNHVEHNSTWQGVRQGVYVPAGTNVRSLASIEIPRLSLTLAENFNKLKAKVFDGKRAYKLSVSSRVLKEAWRNGGLPAARQALPKTARFHVRLGLARAYEDAPDRCYMMLNGVHG